MTIPVNNLVTVTHYVALKGDYTTTGSYIDGGSSTTTSPYCYGDSGHPVARMGDPVSRCPVCHQWGIIIQGLASSLIDGCPEAYDGCVVQCGCPLGSVTIKTPAITGGRATLTLPAGYVPETGNYPDWSLPTESERQYELLLDNWEIANTILGFIPVIGFFTECGNAGIENIKGDKTQMLEHAGEAIAALTCMAPEVGSVADIIRGIGEGADKAAPFGAAGDFSSIMDDENKYTNTKTKKRESQFIGRFVESTC
jgi:uncharacterized Zn-binding protein involved in type VI secretion